MALIRCPDCDRRVSDLAVSCPRCGRPIAGNLPPPEPEPQPTSDPAVQALPKVPVKEPGILAIKRQVKLARDIEHDTSRAKVCEVCGDDVRLDQFRTKTDKGYICSECKGEQVQAQLVWRNRRRTLLSILAALVVLLGGTVGVLALSQMSAPKKSKK